MQRYEKSERSEIRIFQLVEVGQEAVVLPMLASCDRCARLAELPLAIGLVAEVHGSVVTLQGSALHGVRPFWNRVEHGSIVARLTGLRNSHMPATRALILDL